MAVKLGLNLGYWGIGPQGDEAVEFVQAAERAGYDSVWVAESYGSDVVSVLAWLAPQTETIKLGAAIMQVPARPPGGRGDGRVHDRRALGRPLHLRLRAVGPAGLRGLVRRPVREAVGAHPRVRRDRPRDRRPRGPARVRGRALHAAAARRRGQGAEAQLPPGPRPRSRSSSARSAASRSSWRPRSPTAGSRSSPAPDAFEQTLGRACRGRPREEAAAAARTSRSRRRSRSRSTATSRPRAASSRPGCCSTSAAWAAARPTSTSTSRHRFGFGEAADEVQSLYLDGEREEAYEAIPDELVDATSLVGTEEEVAERVERYRERRRRPPDRLADPPRRRRAQHTLERLAALAGVAAPA